ncbi:MAG TPA: hypothetical protein VLF68_02635, partial [Candidatus Saccharimonadales bacterium]|nr:hypothetical protein [Candidatus Saccharimonadales bacterium]
MKKILIVIILLVIVVAGLWFVRKEMRSTTTAPAVPTVAANTDKEQIQTLLEKEVPKRGGVQKFEIIDLKFQGDYARATLKPIDVITDN